MNGEVCEVPGVVPGRPAWQPKSRIGRRLMELGSIDLRSLALFRLALGAILLGDLLVRSSDLVAHYTDFGILPRSALIEQFLHPWFWSLHFFSGTWWGQALLFAVAAVFALMLLVGWRTRLATIMSWILLVSLQERNPMVNQGGDVLLRMLLFWAMFLPIGARYSVDSALDSGSQSPAASRVFSFASLGLLLQPVLVYWFSVIYKSEQEWLIDGTGLYYALTIDQFAEPAAQWLLGLPWLLPWLTRAFYLLQLLGPILLFLPVWTGPVRTITAFIFASWHLSMTWFLAIGPFPWVGAAGVIPYLAPWFWEKFKRWRRRPAGQGLTIFYDLDCGFCRKTALLLREFLLLPAVVIRPAQEDEAAARFMSAKNSWVIADERGQPTVRFPAFLALLRASPVFWWLAPLLAVRPLAAIGGRLYNLVAHHRSIGSRLTAFLKEKPLSIGLPWWANVFAAVCLLAVVAWNVVDARLAPGLVMPPPLRWLAITLAFDQRWAMFASALKDDGWYIMPGRLADGRLVDVFSGRSYVTYAKPASVAETYKNQRWQKYLMNLYGANNRDHRLHYGRYLCRQWNSQHQGNEQLMSFDIEFVREYTLPQFQIAPPRPIKISEHRCF